MIDAIVTGGVDIGDTGRIVKMLTADQGRVAAVAHRARSPKSAMRGLLDPGTRIAVDLKRSKGELPTIAHAELRTGVRRAREELPRLLLLGYGCELCGALAPEHDAAPKLYGLLDAWLARLEDEAAITSISRLSLEAKALTFAGMAPALARCARCSEAIADPCAFDPSAGGAIHARCGSGARIDALSALQIEILRRSPLADAESLDRPQGFEWLLSDFARWHLGHDLRSRALLESL